MPRHKRMGPGRLSEKEWWKTFHALHPTRHAYDYQVGWIKSQLSDPRTPHLAVKARQIGITTTSAVAEFMNCVFWEECEEVPLPPVIVFCSPSARQSSRLMDYVQRVRRQYEKIFECTIPFLKEREDRLLFEHGPEIFSLPNNPRTIEGIDASRAIIDEFGNFSGNEDSQVYESLMGSLGAKGGSMILFGKPRGRRGLFWQFFDPFGEFAGKFNTHKFPWDVRARHDTRYKRTVSEQRDVMTKLAFAEQYECEFVDEGIVMFSYDALDRASKRALPMWVMESSDWHTEYPLYVGIDFAKKINQTVVTMVEHTPTHTAVRFHEVSQETFDKQTEWISAIVKKFKPTKVLVDETGLGGPLLDFLKAELGDLIEGVLFTAQTKERMAVTLKTLFDENRMIIPDDKDLIEQLHGFEKEVLVSGRIRYTGKRTETDWLDDRAWSLMLACSQLGDASWGFTVVDRTPAKDKVTKMEAWAKDIGYDDDGD